MLLKKQTFIFIAQIFFCTVCFAQREQVDSLRKILPFLKDTSRIDCLNELSFQYIKLLLKDSAEYFENAAHKESEKINYAHGIAESISNQSGIVVFFDNDFEKAEVLAKQSLGWFEKTNNKHGIQNAIDNLGFALFAQSKYDEAYALGLKKYENSIKSNDSSEISYALGNLGLILEKEGNYDSAFYFYKRAEDIAITSNDKLLISSALYSFATLYRGIGDYQSSLTTYNKIFQNDTRETIQMRINNSYETWIRMEFAELFALLNKYDSAWHYYRLFDTSKVTEKDLRIYLVSTGETYLLQKNYAKALSNFLRGLAIHKKLNDRNEIKRSLLDVAKAYLALGNHKLALSYAKEGLGLSLQTKSRQFVRDAYQIMYLVYDHIHQTDSAYFYYQKYIVIKDEVVNDQVKGMFAANKYQEEINQVTNEKLISNQQLKIQQQQLEQESLQKKILSGSIIGLLLIGAVAFRTVMLKRKNEKLLLENELQVQKLENQRQLSELELQVLRAQMNPHFIFNSLNSINRFILKKQSSEATEYLNKFSRLIRMILNSSANSSISLAEDIEALKLYLELESLRFDEKFTYNIKFQPDLDVDFIQVPPMLLQPYIENAIWHGIMHKTGKGHLDIEISENDDMLCCRITDNGIGRKQASILKSKSSVNYKSMGMSITAHRIAMLHQKYKTENAVVINDLLFPDGNPGGTEVLIKIPLCYG